MKKIEQEKRARRLYFQGNLLGKDIANTVGVSHTTLSKWIKGWKKDTEKIMEIKKDIECTLVDVVKDDLTKIVKDGFKVYEIVMGIAKNEALKALAVQDTNQRLQLAKKIIGITKECTTSLKTIMPEINEELGAEVYGQVKSLIPY